MAVTQFVSALDPNAKVIRDYKGRDKDTGERQQMDVWVNAIVLGHFPVSILISCKDYKRVLHAGDIRTFRAELIDSSASMGVIYSSRGFNENALAKAKANGICCCRLFQNQPAELPEAISLVSYAARAAMRFPELDFPLEEGFEEMTWDDFLRRRISFEGEDKSISEVIAQVFHQGERWSIDQMTSEKTVDGQRKVFPKGWKSELTLLFGERQLPVHMIVQGTWRKFIGRKEAHLVNGSYSFANEKFHGDQSTPVLDTKGETPGPDWEDMTEDPNAGPFVTITMLQYHAPVAEILPEAMKGKRLGDSLLSEQPVGDPTSQNGPSSPSADARNPPL